MVFTKVREEFCLPTHDIEELQVFSIDYGAEAQNRTVDTSLFRAVLYQLSYLGTLNLHDNQTRGLCRKGQCVYQDFTYKIKQKDRALRRISSWEIS